MWHRLLLAAFDEGVREVHKSGQVIGQTREHITSVPEKMRLWDPFGFDETLDRLNPVDSSTAWL